MKYTKTLNCFVFLFLLNFTSIAQVANFNLQFDQSNGFPIPEGFPAGLIEHNDFYYMAGGFVGSQGNACDTGLVVKINKFTLEATFFKNELHEGSFIRDMQLNTNGELIVSGSKYSCSLDSTDYFLSKIVNDSIKFENTKFFGGPSRHEISNKLIQDGDLNYVSVGWNFKPGSGQGQSITMFKADPDFNFITYRHYPQLDPGEIYFGEAIVETPDGGYIIVGAHTDNIGIQDVVVASIFKVDNDGEVVWWQEFVPDVNGSDEERKQFLDIVKKPNGEYLVIGIKRINPPGPRIVHQWITSFDEDGNLLWEKDIPGNRTSTWVKIRAASDGNYLVSGDDVVAHDTLSGGSNRSATIGKISPDGDILWRRYFDQSDLVFIDTDIFWNVIETSDGGILCSGHTIPDSIAVQNFWLVKLDSMGCLTPGCDSTMVSTDPIILEPSDQLLVYPNPSSGQFKVTTEAGVADVTNISITNMAGQTVSLWSGQEQSVEMDISTYPAGIYLVAARIGGVIYLQKVSCFAE